MTQGSPLRPRTTTNSRRWHPRWQLKWKKQTILWMSKLRSRKRGFNERKLYKQRVVKNSLKVFLFYMVEITSQLMGLFTFYTQFTFYNVIHNYVKMCKLKLRLMNEEEDCHRLSSILNVIHIIGITNFYE